jgi:hypothetical protein
MLPAKLALGCGLVAVLLAGCGSSHTQTAGSGHAGRGVVDDPRLKRLDCIKQHHLPAVTVGQTEIQIGPSPMGPLVEFTPTPGAAQALQIQTQAQGAEAIGSALLYPRQGSEQELSVIERCVSLNVKG